MVLKASRFFILFFVFHFSFFPVFLGAEEANEIKEEKVKHPMVGEKVLDFKLKMVDGGEVQLAELMKNKKGAILFFWATWCPHCRKAIEVFNETAAVFEHKGIVLLTIDLGEKEKIVKKYFKKNNLNLTVLLDEDSAVSERYQVVGVPQTFWINEEGIIYKTSP